MIGRQLSRRDLLKLGSSAIGGLFLSTLGLPSAKAAESTPRLGRVAYNKVTIYDVPDKASGKKLGFHKFNEILTLGETVTGWDESAYNRKWYRLEGEEYVYSGGIQPVKDILNTPVTEIPKIGGLLAELTVPFTDTHWKPTFNSRRGYRLYYGTTYWVRALFEDEKKNLWYRIYDDLMQLVFFIQAEHLRIVPPEEIIPISPDVPEDYKHIVVSLPEQMMAAYEDDRVVFSARVSTGVGKGDSHYASTPTGGFHTFFKRPAGHMVGGDAGSAYDLPGVPWSSYINDSGVSFHGTYWHNDFGTPHSHGCINLPSDDAKWIYRWTTPVVPTGKRYIYKPGTGTTVYISDRPVFQMGWR
jgi:hypothetical protein